MSILVIVPDVSLRKIHAVISSLVFKQMVFTCEPIFAFAGTIVHVAVDGLGFFMSRYNVTIDVRLARECRGAAFPITWHPL